jgi:hypothetical protein
MIASTILACLALIISVITLYVTHLQGPDIQLAENVETYPIYDLIHGFPDQVLTSNMTIENRNGGYITCYEFWTKILILNDGIRSGVLFDLRFSNPSDQAVKLYLEPDPKTSLPTAVGPGEEWSTKLYVRIFAPLGSIQEIQEEAISNIEISYRKSMSLQKPKTKSATIKFDLSMLQDYIDKHQTDHSPK